MQGKGQGRGLKEGWNIYPLKSQALHHSGGGEDENFSSLSVSLLVTGGVLSWHGKLDCSTAF